MTDQNRAILLMISAILCFSIADATVKAVVQNVGVIPMLWARYTGQMLLVFVLVLPNLRRVVQTQYPVVHLLRSILLMGAAAFFFVGLSLIPLTEAAALMATNPVLITLGAALFLRERLGFRRILGIAIALLGAMIIIRPGSEVFTFAAVFPLAAAACYSTYVLLTRRIGAREDAWTSLFYTGVIGTVVLSFAVPFAWQTPEVSGVAGMALVAVMGTVGHLALIRAFSHGEAVMLAPYSYSGLAFAAIWGMLFFSEIPDFWTILGSLIIAGAGLYVWYRETYKSDKHINSN
jgi:drug/metabolite transporter (DMT)-like permease